MKYLIGSMAFVILVLTGYIFYINESSRIKETKEAAYWKGKAFKTDTVYSEKIFSKTIVKPSNSEPIPPKETIIYQTEKIPQSYIEFQDKILSVIDSLKNTKTVINPLFLTQYPTSPKFLGGKFRKDTIALSLMDINGVIKTDIYPVNYSAFKYDYLNNSMNATKSYTRNDAGNTKKPFISYIGTNLEYKRDLLQSQHQMELNSGFKIWKFTVGGYTQYPITDNAPKLQGGIKAGIRLF